MLGQQGYHQRQSTEDDPAGHTAIETEEIEPVIDRRLRRRNPFEEMPSGDEQPRQGSPDRIAHQPCLVAQERDDERPLGERDAQITAKRRQMAARRYPGMARNNGGNHRNDGGQKDRRENEADPYARSSEGQGQSRQQRQHGCWRG